MSLNPNSLIEAIQIATQLEQKWKKVKIAKQRIQELAYMNDHDLEQCQDLDRQIIRQINQQRGSLGYQLCKSSQRFSEEQKKTFQQKQETQTEKATLLSVGRIWEEALPKAETSQITSRQKQIKEKEMARIYQNLIISAIGKLNASFKKPVRRYLSLLMNGQR